MNGRKRQDWVWLTLNQSSSRGRESLDQSVGKRGFAPFYLSAHRSCVSPPLPAFPFIPRPAEFGRKNEATPSGLSASIDFHSCSSQLVSGSDGIECIASSEQILELFLNILVRKENDSLEFRLELFVKICEN